MNATLVRKEIDQTVGSLMSLRELIINRCMYAEELPRIDEMCATMLAIASLNDPEIQERVAHIGRINDGMNQYSSFMSSLLS